MNYNLTRHELRTRIVVEHVSHISLMLTMLSLYCVIIVSLNCWTVFIVIIKALPEILLVNSFILDRDPFFYYLDNFTYDYDTRSNLPQIVERYTIWDAFVITDLL